MGQLYLTNVDFLKNGVPASVIAALVSVAPHLFLHGMLTTWYNRWSHHSVMR
jgi:hypothetical protein